MRDGDSVLDLPTATRLVRRAVDERLSVTAIRALRGGMLHRVLELTTDGEPGAIVAKLGTLEQEGALQRERAVLDWYRAHTELPVPRVFSVVQPLEGFAGSVLLMERIAGRNLADAQLSDKGRRHVQLELAHHVAALHTHTRGTFGSVLADEPMFARWVDMFRPMLRREFDAVGHLLQPRSRDTVGELVDRLDRVLASEGHATPTLIHGDLWSTNILVDDAHSDRPRITAFVDCGANFCDTEYELAYLQLFHTADDVFFTAYHRMFPPRRGWEKRFRVYWLNTMLLHLRIFGDQYLRNCNELAQQVRGML